MKKKIWKQIIAVIMACALITGTAGSNTALAAGNNKNITATSLPVKVSGKTTKESSIAVNIKPGERAPELDNILNECEEIKTDGISKEIRKGQMMSVESISNNEDIKAAIMENGDLYCWGYNECGQVGNGTTENQLTPVKVLSGVKSVTSSSYYSSYISVSAITENGDLYCWGYNGYGQVGNGTTENQLTPVKVLSGIKSVTYSPLNHFATSSHSVSAITENGDLYCWGYNGYGQIGNGTTENQLTPVKVLSGVKSVTYSCSHYTSVSAITKTGDLYCWGDNEYGQVGNGTTENQLTPIKVLNGVKSVTYSYAYSVSAITENGDLYCWGYNGYGQVGNGTTENQLTPIKVLNGIKSVTYSSYSYFSHSSYISVSAITENGDLYCWGYNRYGQIGNGTRENQLTPIKVLSGVKSVTYSSFSDYLSDSSYSSVLVITENGDLYCWGYNAHGQIGNGTTESQLTPVKVLSGVKSVTSSSSDYSSYSVSAITESGDLYCWGYNGYGQVGNGTTENQLTPVKVLSRVKSVTSSYSVSATTENGDLYCWGYNAHGQIGNGTTESQLMPVRVLSRVKSVTYDSSCPYSVSAITENGDLYCWGENEYGQIGNGTTEEQLTPIKILPIGSSGDEQEDVVVNDPAFISEHLDFVNSKEYTNKMDSTYAKMISKGLDTTKGKIGESIYKALNTGCEILSCKSLKIFENPYDAVIMDLILDQSDVKLKDYTLSFETELSKNISMIEELCSISQYKDEWTLNREEYKTQLEHLIEKPESMKESNPVFYELCQKIFKDVFDSKQLDKILDAYGKATELQSALDTYSNVIGWVSDCIKYNSLVKAYIDTSNEFKQALAGAEYFMEANLLNDSYFSRTQYAIMYADAVDKYTNFLNEDKVTKMLFEEYTVNGLKRIADIFGNAVVKNATIYLSEGLGISAAAASWIYACIEAYKTGWKISEAITDNGKIVECRELARASYYLEDAMKWMAENAAASLKKDKNMQSAKLFDAAFTILQDLECYSLNNYAKYLDIQQKSFVQWLAHGFNKQYNMPEIEFVKMLELEWKNTCCHKGIKNSVGMGKVNNIMVCCPTDVYVYDKDGESVLIIEDNFVTKDARCVSAAVVGDIKIISLPDIENYKIDIKATDNGIMSVFTNTYIPEEEKLTASSSYIDVPIEKNKVYNLEDTSLKDEDTIIEPTLKTDNMENKILVSSITIENNVNVLKIGDKINLKAVVAPDNVFCPVVSWSVSGSSIATIDEDGTLIAKNIGKAEVQCTAIDGSGITSTVKIDVKPAIYFESNGGNIKEPELYDIGVEVSVPSAIERTGYTFTGWYIDKELTKKFEKCVMPDNNIILYAGWTKNDSDDPVVTHSPLPSNTPMSKPSGGSSGGGTTSGGGGGFIGGVSVSSPSPLPSQMPSPSPSTTTVTTSIPDQTQVPVITPQITPTPLPTPELSQTPEATLTPSASPVAEENNNTSSSVKLKKGSKVKDKKTKAVYKIISTGENKTAEYAKSTKKNTANIVIPASVKFKGKTFKVVSIGKGAFKNNKKLKSVKIGKNVKAIAKEAFSGCKKLAKVKIGKNVNSIGTKAFSNCTSLTIITIPSKVNKIGKKAFYQCKNLKYILIKTKKLKPGNIGSNAFSKGYSNPRVKSDKSVWKQYQNTFISKGLSNKALFIINPAKLVV